MTRAVIGFVAMIVGASFFAPPAGADDEATIPESSPPAVVVGEQVLREFDACDWESVLARFAPAAHEGVPLETIERQLGSLQERLGPLQTSEFDRSEPLEGVCERLVYAVVFERAPAWVSFDLCPIESDWELWWLDVEPSLVAGLRIVLAQALADRFALDLQSLTCPEGAGPIGSTFACRGRTPDGCEFEMSVLRRDELEAQIVAVDTSPSCP